MKLLSAITMASFVVTTLSAGTIELPRKEQLHIYLLLGQSNMAGRGKVEEQDKTPHPRVLTYSTTNTWKPAIDPLHSDRSHAGVGLGLTFGKVMAEHNPDITIGLVPCAVGGTPLSRWSKDGDLFSNAVVRAHAAMKDGTLKGILWHQGENDALTNSTAETYADRLVTMIADLRKELRAPSVPFVAGEIGEFLYVRPQTPYAKLINEQLNQVPGRVQNCALVPAKGLVDHGDKVHFDSASLREFGRRYAATMKTLQSARPKVANTRR